MKDSRIDHFSPSSTSIISFRLLSTEDLSQLLRAGMAELITSVTHLSLIGRTVAAMQVPVLIRLG